MELTTRDIIGLICLSPVIIGSLLIFGYWVKLFFTEDRAFRVISILAIIITAGVITGTYLLGT